MQPAISRLPIRQGVPVWREMGAVQRKSHATSEPAKVVIVGSGPVGLALAIDLGQRGHEVLVLARFDFIPAGSKAICFSKRSLDILDRLGVGEATAERGVSWNVGKVFWRDRAEPIYQFDMQPVKNQKMPGFINLQQYALEELLIARIAELPGIEVRWGHQVAGIAPHGGGARLSVTVDNEDYVVEAEWVIACDGSKSAIRQHMGLDFVGRAFEDNFLIADIRMQDERPSERWFWFDPPFNPGRSALLHKQPDDMWRLDFQLGREVDRNACIRPENVDPLIRAMLGDEVHYEPEWYSVYSFQCRRMERFLHGRVIFAGDSAHLVSPFGARGCNGGLADVDNLGWKLDLVLSTGADEGLLETYNDEAVTAADENILCSARSTDFLAPEGPASEAFRDAVLELASDAPFARAFVNSGRLSTAVSYPNSHLNTADADQWEGGVAPGSPAIDAPLGQGWLLEQIGQGFVLVGWDCPGLDALPIRHINLTSHQHFETLRERYDFSPGSAYLFRPDQYVAARFRKASVSKVEAAVARASGERCVSCV